VPDSDSLVGEFVALLTTETLPVTPPGCGGGKNHTEIRILPWGQRLGKKQAAEAETLSGHGGLRKGHAASARVGEDQELSQESLQVERRSDPFYASFS